jgi:hypothetical protein
MMEEEYGSCCEAARAVANDRRAASPVSANTRAHPVEPNKQPREPHQVNVFPYQSPAMNATYHDTTSLQKGYISE